MPAGISREQLQSVIDVSPYTRWIGVSLVRYEPGRVEIEVPLREELRQHHGFAHGAVVGFMADSACAWGAASLVGDVVTSEYKINLLSPAIGELLSAVGDVVKASNRQVIMRADVFAHQGEQRKLVAVALATIAGLTDEARL